MSKHTLKINSILDSINNSNVKLGDEFSISQGIVTGIDRVSPKHGRKFNAFKNRIGEGVFIIDQEFKDSLPVRELEIIKPWFKNSDIQKFSTREVTDKYLIHINAETDLSNYPVIEKHLLEYQELIKSRNFESGELSKAKRMGSWWALSSSRRDFDFSKPKIISPQRSYENNFGFTDKLWCASADVYFITAKTENCSIYSLLVLLNSNLYYHWLYHRGKRKGDMLELYLTPLANIPLPNLTNNQQHLFDLLSQLQIFYTKKKKSNNQFVTTISDGIVYEIFFPDHMKERKIDILQFVEKDKEAIMQNREFDQLTDDEKEKVINQLYARWTDPESEIVKRMNSFAEKSPDILKPILEIR